jgi:hypothetical protein
MTAGAGATMSLEQRRDVSTFRDIEIPFRCVGESSPSIRCAVFLEVRMDRAKVGTKVQSMRTPEEDKFSLYILKRMET